MSLDNHAIRMKVVKKGGPFLPKLWTWYPRQEGNSISTGACKITPLETERPITKSMIPTAFPQFLLLPSELQAEIWKLSLSSRTIKIRFTPYSHNYSFIAKQPNVLLINTEIRIEFQKLYRLVFGGERALNLVHFNPCLDTLELPQYKNQT